MKLLHEDASARTLRAARLWVFGLWILKTVTDPLERLAEIPSVVLQPVGLLRLIPAGAWEAIVTTPFLVALRVVTIGCLALSCAGRWQTPAALASGLLLTFYQGLLRSVGYVNHQELVLLYAVFVLALAPIVERLAARAGRASKAPEWSAVSMIAVAVVLCSTYTLTGVARLAFGVPSVFHPDTVVRWILAYSYDATYYTWQVGRAVLDVPPPARWLLTAGVLAVTALEVLAPCCLISRRFRLAFLVAMIAFHLFVFVTMNVFFWEYLALCVFLLDLEGLLGARPLTWPSSGH